HGDPFAGRNRRRPCRRSTRAASRGRCSPSRLSRNSHRGGASRNAAVSPMNDILNRQNLSKVPEVTLVFWIIKIAATTLGETGGDTVTMTLNWGYLAGTILFTVILVALVIFQIAAKKFHS